MRPLLTPKHVGVNYNELINTTQNLLFCSVWSKLNTEIGLHTTHPPTTNFWTTYRHDRELKFTVVSLKTWQFHFEKGMLFLKAVMPSNLG